MNYYCTWKFDLNPELKYLIYIKRSSPPIEQIELQIQGEIKNEYIEDYRLRYDRKTANKEGWNRYLLA